MRNEPTTHYRARLDHGAALRKELEKEGRKEESIACAVAAMPPNCGQYDVWIDGDGLVRRTRITTSWRGLEPMTAVDTTEFFAYGTEVTIAPPPADQVVDEEDCADLYDEGG